MRDAAPVVMRAGELCIREVFTAQRGETISDIAKRMAERNVGDLVVVDDQDPRIPVGIITDRDLVVRVLAHGDRAPSEVTVGEVMSSEFVAVLEGDDLETVVSRLRLNAIRRIAVVDGEGYLQGIVSLDDILEWIGAQVATVTRLVERQLHVAAR
ncbi:MAG: histidine kinase [Myxococcales bacterium]|nr:histidine kinase [Myxococcales bacterium]